MKIVKLTINLSLLLFLACACSLKTADNNEVFLPERQVEISKLLRISNCQELFLAEGYDATTSQKGKGLPEEVAVYDEAFRLCSELTPEIQEADNNLSDKSFPTINLGLALSGGGTRSGSFAIGVLKALDEIEIAQGESLLRQVDTISSVSGGGYAAYWYLTQNYYLDPAVDVCTDGEKGFRQVNKTIFRTRSDPGFLGDIKYQEHVATTSDLINISNNAFLQPVEDIWLTSGHFLSLPLHWVANGIFDWPTNTSAFALGYQQGIERTYGLSLKNDYSPFIEERQDTNDKYVNAQRGRFAFWNSVAQADPVTFGQYRKFLVERNSNIHANNSRDDKCSSGTEFIHPLPLPVINTTLGTRTKKLPLLDKAVFTFTPLGYGSGLTGYTDDQTKATQVELSKAYAISGAAVDANARESNWFFDFFLWGADLNLGYRHPNINNNTNPLIFNLNRGLHYVLPIGLYHLHDRLTPDTYKASYRLSDGGQSENLGLYALIKRGARHAIVIDAEYDPDYQFDALRRVKANIEHEMDLKLTLDDKQELGDKFKERRHPLPVFTGKIKGVNKLDGNLRDIDFIYLKMALDQDEYDRVRSDKEYTCSSTTSLIKEFNPTLGQTKVPLPCSVVDFIRSEKLGKKSRFPHNSTADIFYDEVQFRAFRDFGYYLVMTEMRKVLFADTAGYVRLAKLMSKRDRRFKFFEDLVKKAKETKRSAPH